MSSICVQIFSGTNAALRDGHKEAQNVQSEIREHRVSLWSTIINFLWITNVRFSMLVEFDSMFIAEIEC